MASKMSPMGIGRSIEHITRLLDEKKTMRIGVKSPCGFDDIQEQTKASFEFVQFAYSYMESGDYWLAIANFLEDLKYYRSLGEIGKCGHVLVEIADCLFSVKEWTASIECCEEALRLLVSGRDEHVWVRGMAALSELLLMAVALNSGGIDEALKTLRRVRSALTPGERRILSNEDAHRVARRLIIAYRAGSSKPLEELAEIVPKRKRLLEEQSLLALFHEWAKHYSSLKYLVEKSIHDG